MALPLRSQGPGPIGVRAMFTMRSLAGACGFEVVLYVGGVVVLVIGVVVVVVVVVSGCESGPEQG